MSEHETLAPPPPAPKSLALIPYYGTAPLAHHLSVRASGIRVASVRNDASIDAVRSILVAIGLQRSDAEIFVFIDSDIEFTRSGYDRLARTCSDTEGVVGGAYAKKGSPGITATLLHHERALGYGSDGAVYSAKTLGMGFTAIHRKALEKIGEALPTVSLLGGPDPLAGKPFFLPMIYGVEYVREDYAFCIRAAEAGVPVLLDTVPELIHHGEWGFRVEAEP